MPRILTAGDAEWQFRVHNECRNCGAVYVLEKGDGYSLVRPWLGQPSYRAIASICPTCGSEVQTANPNYKASAADIAAGPSKPLAITGVGGDGGPWETRWKGPAHMDTAGNVTGSGDGIWTS